ncbi:MAG: S-methyl-5-thioribose-1-phosphate isomerase [Desulfonatronovibrionaceae bacterium]
MEHIYFDQQKKQLMLLDQRYLPGREDWFECRTAQDIVTALQEMVVRGAPAIGVTAAYGCALAALECADRPDFRACLQQKLEIISNARPTAANLAWAVRLMQKHRPDSVSGHGLYALWLDRALEIHRKDISINKTMGRFGAELLEDGDTVMTHCNAGALATGGYGTALGVVRAAVEQGKKIKVIANETRPFLQGARLTAYELARDGIEVVAACDNACAHLMHKGLVDKVVVGADRIAANGDAANKIGTFLVALAAKAHDIPFYVAAPLSTFDLETLTGSHIPIENRTPDEVRYINNRLILPTEVQVFNFAFDVTPAALIHAIITEKGVLKSPDSASVARLFFRETPIS